MPYVPPDVKERIKREISIQRLAEARGIKLVRSGKELIGLCPFHDDRNPSLNIDPAKNVWHCKGACGEGGDVIQWVMRAEGVSFNHALEMLKREHFPLAAGPIQPVKHSTVRKLPPLIDATAEDKKLLEIVVKYYHETLVKEPEAQRYLVKRGLQSSEIIDRFRLGFANRTLSLHLPASNRLDGEAQRTRLKELGVLRNQKPGHEHFNGSLVIPIFNLAGEVVEMYGRKITSNLRAGTDHHTYLPGPHRGVWNEEALIASKEIILCEALIDALTFWCAGYRNVTASYGVNGFTEDHRRAFERHGTKRVYIAYDRDDAGDKAAAKLAEELIEMGIECFRVEFPKGMDANEYALKVTPATKSLGVLLNRAAWLGKGARPAGRVAVPVIVAEPPAAEKPTAKEEEIEPQEPVAAPPIAAAPAADEPTAKGKIIEEPMPEPGQESMSATVASEPHEEPQRAFSLAVNAVPLEEPAARPMPLAVPDEPKVEIDGEEVKVTIGPRVYRVLGLQKNTSLGVMRINVRVTGTNVRGEFCYHGDTLDMESARQRMMFAKQAAHELGLKEEAMYREVGRLWMKLGDVQREQIRQALTAPPEEARMTAEEQTAAMDLLRDPRLMARVLEDFERCGVVGEETNKTVSYLAAVSRLMAAPLAIIVQSGSAAGKTSLMDAVLAFLPEEQRVQYSAMTGQALFYLGETELKHKVLAVGRRGGRATRGLRVEAVAIGRRADHRLHRQGVEHRAADYPSLPRGRPGDDLPHDHGCRDGRGTVEPLHRAHGERRPGADQGDPSQAARGADARGPVGARGAHGHPQTASQRTAALAPLARSQRACAFAQLPLQPHPDQARPHEVPDADQCDRAASSASARDQARHAPRQDARIHRGHGSRRGDGPPACEPCVAAVARRPAAADAPLASADRADGCERMRAPPDRAR